MTRMGPRPTGGGGGVAWNDTRENGDGVGLLHTIGAGASSGVQSFKTILDDSQSNALIAHEINLGASSFGHRGLRIIALGNSNSQKAVDVVMGAGIGIGFNIGGTGAHTAFRSAGQADPGMVGFEYYNGATGSRGTAFKVDVPVSGRITDLKVFSANLAAASQSTAYNTNLFELFFSRNMGGAPTYTSDFALAYFKRTASAAAGNPTEAGSVVKIENVSTPVINDLVDVLKIVQDVDSDGNPLSIEQPAVVSTNFKKYLSLDGLIIYKSINGTTPNGNLPGNQGDVCYNGPAGKSFYCSGGTAWV